MPQVTWDIAVLVFLALASLRGFWRGMCRELGSLLGCLSGIVVGWKSAMPLAESARTGSGGAASELDAALLFLVVFVGLWALGAFLGWLGEKLMRSPAAAWASGFGGLLVGGIKGATLAGICLVFVQLFVPQAAAQLQQTALSRWLTQTTSAAATWLVQQQVNP
ncbi:MAG: CvpA family protein [candidate division KSB1 bacterium]|nr:CvpA family protein [candidate division KSB1 bacterium]